MNKRAFLLSAFIACLLAGKLAAQQPAYPEGAALIYRPFQLSIIPPLGTNGLEGGRAVNNFSLNLLLGDAAGLEGIELAGLANLEKYHVGGIQVAGFLNGAGGAVEGIQLAIFANLSRGIVQGAQFAGFANLNGSYSYVAQFAGFMNITKRVNGLQLAGFLNISQQLKGVQLGVVNVADSVEKGTPVGVFSIVRKGYNHWEVWTNETMHINTCFKFGTKSFYNILAVGSSLHPLSDRRFLGLGYGIGHAFALQKAQLSLDALGYQLHRMDAPFQSGNGFTQLYQLKLSYDCPLKKLACYAGPVFNTLVQYNKQTNDTKWNALAPYTFYSHTGTNNKGELWAGLQAGIRF